MDSDSQTVARHPPILQGGGGGGRSNGMQFSIIFILVILIANYL